MMESPAISLITPEPFRWTNSAIGNSCYGALLV
jgi:hypothetical protein